MTQVLEKEQFEVQVKTREGSFYQGPLELLWKLIESYEVDIFEVSLTRITDDFISYMQSHSLDIETASDFVEMAARLIYYKSKLLLPDPGYEEEYEDDVLPFELVEQLLEHKRFQNAAEIIRQYEEAANMCESREATWSEYDSGDSFLQVDLIHFLKIFKEFLEKAEKNKPVEIENEQFTIEDIIEEMQEHLSKNGYIKFFEYITGLTMMKSIGCFLAVLELAKGGEISIEQEDLYTDIIISLKSSVSGSDL